MKAKRSSTFRVFLEREREDISQTLLLQDMNPHTESYIKYLGDPGKALLLLLAGVWGVSAVVTGAIALGGSDLKTIPEYLLVLGSLWIAIALFAAYTGGRLVGPFAVLVWVATALLMLVGMIVDAGELRDSPERPVAVVFFVGAALFLVPFSFLTLCLLFITLVDSYRSCMGTAIEVPEPWTRA
jgi:hypothetical protein